MPTWMAVGFVRLAMLPAPWLAAPAIAEAQVVAVPPAPPGGPRIYVPPELMPKEANGVAGDVHLRITIAPDRSITACKVSLGVNPVLDAASCPFLLKRFWAAPSIPVTDAKPREMPVTLVWWAPFPADIHTNFGGAAPIGVFWITNDDYPPAALRAKEGGDVAVRFTISDVGRVEACEVTETSGSASLDAAPCRLIQRRARFLAALDERDRPRATTGTMLVRWRISE